MKKNMGSADSITRLILASIIVLLYFTHIIAGITGIILLILGAVFVLTAFIKFCPLYLPFKFSTAKNKTE